MKGLSFYLFLFVLLVVSCHNDDSQYKKPVTDALIRATIENDVTRTYLHNDGKSIYWELDDSLSVFLGASTMNCATVYGVPDGYNADFIVDADIILGGTTSPDGEAYTNVALYPYDRNASLLNNDLLKTVFPSVQKAVVNSIPDGSIMVAVVDNITTTSFTFRNVSSFLRLSIKSDISAELSSIVLTSLDGAVSGSVNITASAGALPTIAFNSDALNTITLDCDGVSIGATPTVLFMALPPTVISDGGWSLKITDSNSRTMELSLPAFAFERNRYYTLDVDYEVDEPVVTGLLY